MDQPALDNRTEFAVHPQMLLDVDGERLVAIVKASFEFEAATSAVLDLAPADRTRGVRMADIPWGEPEVSSIAYPADLCLRKPGTDVIVVGCAHAPRGEAVPSFDVRVEVGPVAKSLTIFGTRVWKDAGTSLSEPLPVKEMQLRYEHAWGGFDDSDPEDIVEEARNPIGTGKVADSDALIGQAAPNIEDPAQLLGALNTSPPPAGVGVVGRHWEPRRRYAGSYDDIWAESRCPLPPTDFDDRFNLCAAAGLTSTKPLVGGEEVGLLNVLPGGGATQFKLPKIEVTIEFRVKGRDTVVLRPYLDTVLLDLLMTGPDKPAAVELVWRASIKAPRNLGDAAIIVRERDVP